MAVAFPTAVMAGCAFLAGLSWTFRGATGRTGRELFVPSAIIGWTVFSCAAVVLGAQGPAGQRRQFLGSVANALPALLALLTSAGYLALLRRVATPVLSLLTAALAGESLELSCCALAAVCTVNGALCPFSPADAGFLACAGAEICLAHLLLLFPRGREPQQGRRCPLAGGAGAFLVLAIAHGTLVLTPGPLQEGSAQWILAAGYLLLGLCAWTGPRRHQKTGEGQGTACPFVWILVALSACTAGVGSVVGENDGTVAALLGTALLLSVVAREATSRQVRSAQAELVGTRQRLSQILGRTTVLLDRDERLSRFDQLTALPNHTYVSEVTDAWLGSGMSVTLFHLDIVGFAGINDRFGRDAGDKVLIEVSRRLRSAVQTLDVSGSIIGRVGSDEFVVALAEADGADRVGAGAGHVLLGAIRPSFLVRDRTVRLGLTMGVTRSADLPGPVGPVGPAGRARRAGRTDSADKADRGSSKQDLQKAALLLHRAGIALAAARDAELGPVVQWDAGIERSAVRRLDIAIGLRRALDTGRLRLVYQPLVRLSDGVVVGAEALVRLNQEDKAPGVLSWLPQIVSPEELIAVAEDSGAIDDLGEWVLTEAARQAARWRAQGHRLSVGVNVSARQLGTGTLVEIVRRVLRTSGLPPDGLVIEVTESRLLGQGQAIAELEYLADEGILLAVDDFGSGYSSLSYLLRLPARIVKLDREMLNGLGTDPRAMTMARSVIGMLRGLGMLVVAEGLEDQATVGMVRDLGAYCGQGFALSVPLSPEDMEELLSRSPEGHGVLAGESEVRTPEYSVRKASVVVSECETRRGGD